MPARGGHADKVLILQMRVCVFRAQLGVTLPDTEYTVWFMTLLEKERD